MGRYNKDNFFDTTAAVFKVCDKPESEPDYISDSGSAYWYTKDGVVRYSDHWGWGIGGCNWWLHDLEMGWFDGATFLTLNRVYGNDKVAAYCPFDGFKNSYELANSVGKGSAFMFVQNVNDLF